MKKTNWNLIWKQRYLFLLASPAVILTLVFSYAPMTGIYMAFTDFRTTRNGYWYDLFHSPFVGLEWFRFFFANDFFVVMRNTLGMSLLTWLISFPAPIVLAVFLNEVKTQKLKKGIQTVSYLPYFISWVIAANMVLTLLSANGAINSLLVWMGVTEDPIIFMQESRFFWWIIAILNTWKSMGYNAIVFLAAIAGISQDQYEAADIDGARRWQKVIYVTLPSLLPVIVILMILSVGNLLSNGFEQIILLQNPSLFRVSDVLDTYVFRFGMQNGMWSFSTAVGLFRSVVTFILVVIANMVSKKVNGSGLF